jgi:hypothetical protein
VMGPTAISPLFTTAGGESVGESLTMSPRNTHRAPPILHEQHTIKHALDRALATDHPISPW